MINHLSVSHLDDNQFLNLSKDQIITTVKKDAGFDISYLGKHEIDSKPARINAIFMECISRVMISNLTDSQKVQKYWDFVDMFNGVNKECFELPDSNKVKE